jgi:hypothetical protein
MLREAMALSTEMLEGGEAIFRAPNTLKKDIHNQGSQVDI